MFNGLTNKPLTVICLLLVYVCYLLVVLAVSLPNWISAFQMRFHSCAKRFSIFSIIAFTIFGFYLHWKLIFNLVVLSFALESIFFQYLFAAWLWICILNHYICIASVPCNSFLVRKGCVMEVKIFYRHSWHSLSF